MFDLKIKNFNGKEKLIKNINLNLTGDYNVKNATAALSVSLTLGIKINIIKEALKNFSGVQRRMTKIFSKNRNDFYDDYAHHPTEIKAVIEGAKKFSSNKKLVVVFQPHRFSRVNDFINQFCCSVL